MKHFCVILSQYWNLLSPMSPEVITLHKECPSTELFLVCILLYSVRIQENTDQKKLCIWALFTHVKDIDFLRIDRHPRKYAVQQKEKTKLRHRLRTQSNIKMEKKLLL